MPEKPRFFGRRKGRPLNTGRASAMEEVLPRVRVTLDGDQPLDPAVLQPGMREYHLEIGFGNGEHLLDQAAAQPTTGFIGAEPFVNGYAHLLSHMSERGLTNIRLWPDPVFDLLHALKPASLDCIYLLFSDPWPKARHAPRRVLQQETIDLFARALKPGGMLRIATDDPTLQDWTAEQMGLQKHFTPAPGLLATRPTLVDWPTTRYEQKALKAGRTPKYWVFKR